MINRDFRSYLKPPTLATPSDFGVLVEDQFSGSFLRPPNLQLTHDFGAYLKRPGISDPAAFAGYPRQDFSAYGDEWSDMWGSEYDAPASIPDATPDPSVYTDAGSYSYDPSADSAVTIQELSLQDVPAGSTGGFDWGALANKLIAAGPTAIGLAQRAGIINAQQAATLNTAVTGQGPRQPVNPTPHNSAAMGTGMAVLLGIGALVAVKVFRK